MDINLILFDDRDQRADLLPLTFTRPISELRVGILKIREKWEHDLGSEAFFLTESYLGGRYPLKVSEYNLLVNASVCPDDDLIHAVRTLQPGQTLASDDIVIAQMMTRGQVESDTSLTSSTDSIHYEQTVRRINYPWDIFRLNGEELEQDFLRLTKGRKSASLPSIVTVLGDHPVFIEADAVLSACTINASRGPVYIGRDAEVMEGCLIRGPFSLGEHSILKMGAKIYGPTTVGPHSRVGGELNNVVIQGYSNKAHDGFLGQAVIGEWCNLGADTNNSNLKNTYDEVRMWNYREERFISTGLQFCGLIMGDHSKCGINTMFNTGTVVGVSSNIFGSGYQRNFIPSFSWGGPHGMQRYDLDKAMQVADSVMFRRGMKFDDVDRGIFRYLFNLTKYRPRN